MTKDIKTRIIKEAKYLISSKQTIREVAKYFNISKSTIHKDLHLLLPTIDPSLAYEVRQILDEHLKVRHLRGGESTKIKYQQLKNEKIKHSYFR